MTSDHSSVSHQVWIFNNKPMKMIEFNIYFSFFASDYFQFAGFFFFFLFSLEQIQFRDWGYKFLGPLTPKSLHFFFFVFNFLKNFGTKIYSKKKERWRETMDCSRLLPRRSLERTSIIGRIRKIAQAKP